MSSQGSFLSDVFRTIVTIAAVCGVLWYGYTNNIPDKILESTSTTTSSSPSPEWDESFGQPSHDSRRPYGGYLDKSMRKLSSNIGSFHETPGYSRKKFFIYDGNSWNKVHRKESRDAGWEGFAHESCSVRYAVLISQGDKVKVSPPCSVSGTFRDAYGKRDKNGKVTYKKSTQPKDFDIDHVVALSLAWRSGMDNASPTLRNMVANDKANLVVSDPTLNRSKGDQSIDTWFPPKDSSGYCDYNDRYAYIKAKYNMIVTQEEFNTIATIAKNCSRS